MNKFIVFAGLLAVANAGIIAAPAALAPVAAGSVLVRAPEHDSAAIESHRLGGNFAYGVVTAEAFAKVTPTLNTITHPVAETTHVHEPAPIAHVQPAPIEHTHYAAQAIIREEPILAQQQIIGPVATETRVHQPLIKTVHAAPVAHFAAPAGYAHLAAAPAGYAHFAGAPLAAAHIAA